MHAYTVRLISVRLHHGLYCMANFSRVPGCMAAISQSPGRTPTATHPAAAFDCMVTSGQDLNACLPSVVDITQNIASLGSQQKAHWAKQLRAETK